MTKHARLCLLTAMSAVLLSISTFSGFSATLTLVGLVSYEDYSGAPAERVEYRLEGMIEPGDSEKIKKAIPSLATSNGQTRPRLRLSSPGGNLAEAVAIGEYLWRNGIGTYVNEGDHCLSACAIVFMSGSRWGGDDFFAPDRTLNIKGRVGFHAPFLDKDAFLNIPREVASVVPLQTFRGALDTAASLIRLARLIQMPDSLLEQMLRVPEGELLFIEKIDHIGRWSIVPEGLPRHLAETDRDYVAICRNGLSWHSQYHLYRDAFANLRTDGGGSVHIQQTPERWERSVADIARDDRSEEKDKFGINHIVFTLEGTDGSTTCRIPAALGSGGSIQRTMVITPDNIQLRPELWKSLPPYMSFAALLAHGLPASGPSSLPLPGRLLLDHNGSKMELIERLDADGRTRIQILYVNPSERLKAAGTGAGTVLFDGQKVGDRISGNAYTFSSRCGPVAYPVSGKLAAGAAGGLVLAGRAPVRDGCRVIGSSSSSVHSTLKFTRIAE